LNATRFDRISRLFAERKLSRRQAFATGATAIAAAGLGSADAQDATPQATPVATPVAGTGPAKPVTFMFVQGFQSGTLTPVAGSSDTFTLSLASGMGQTVYFSDRPERVVGAVPTVTFLQRFPFGKENPPNAALVMEASPGEVDVVVLELTEPTYDETSHAATYQARILEDFEEIGTTFQEQPQSAQSMAREFGAASLFIDDCPNAYVGCFKNGNFVGYANPDAGLLGFCYNWGYACCAPCDGDQDDYENLCADEYGQGFGLPCNDDGDGTGGCTASVYGYDGSSGLPCW
jgi:hypothetical protein